MERKLLTVMVFIAAVLLAVPFLNGMGNTDGKNCAEVKLWRVQARACLGTVSGAPGF